MLQTPLNTTPCLFPHRSSLAHHTGAGLKLRASQGHSKGVAERIDQSKLLTSITLDSAPDVCIHGTYAAVLGNIMKEGLKVLI